MRRFAWLGAILMTAFALRLHQISVLALRADEAAGVLLAQQDLQSITRPFLTTDPHLPLYYLILHFWILIAGSTEIAVRFLTVLAGVVSVALVYALGRQLFPRRKLIAQLAAFFTATSPYLIWDAQDSYVYSFLTALAGASFYFFLRAIQPGAQRRTWAAYIIINALALFAHYFASFILLAEIGLVLYWRWRNEMSQRTCAKWLGALGIIVLLFLPWIVRTWDLLTNFTTGFLPWASIFEVLNRSLLAFTVGRAEDRLMPAIVDPESGNLLAIGFLALWLVGLFAAGKGNDEEIRGRVILLAYLLIPLLAFSLFSTIRFPIFDERYVLYLAPAFVLLLARGLVSLDMLTKRRWITALACGYIVLASVHSLYNYYYVPRFAKSPDWQGLIAVLSSQARPGDVVIQNYPDPALPYYLENRVPRILLPRSSSEGPDAVDADLDRIADKYTRLWLQPVPGGEWDNDGNVQTWFDRHARLLHTFQFRGITLGLYLPSSVAIAQANPVGAEIGKVRLEAFEWDEPEGHLVLYWRAVERVEEEATVFVHVYDAQGRLIAQRDNAPVHGSYKTNVWRPGVVVADSYDLAPLPENMARAYELAVGMYDAQTLQRLSAIDAEGKPYPENRILLVASMAGGAR